MQTDKASHTAHRRAPHSCDSHYSWRKGIPAAVLLLVVGHLPVQAAVINTTWLGGSGDWTDSNWSGLATYPDNAGSDFFNVSIDGAGSGDSVVGLNDSVTVDRLEVSPGDKLVLGASAAPTLRLDQDTARPGSGELINEAGIIEGRGFLGFGSMLLENRGGIIAAAGGIGTLVIDPSGTNDPSVVGIKNGGAILTRTIADTLVLADGYIQQDSIPGLSGLIAANGGTLRISDTIVDGGRVEVGIGALGKLELQRGSLVSGTGLTIGNLGSVEAIGPLGGGVLPALTENNGVIAVQNTRLSLDSNHLWSAPLPAPIPGTHVFQNNGLVDVHGDDLNPGILNLSDGDVIMQGAPGQLQFRGNTRLTGATEPGLGNLVTLWLGPGINLVFAPGSQGTFVAENIIVAPTGGAGANPAIKVVGGADATFQQLTSASADGAFFSVQVQNGGTLRLDQASFQNAGTVEVDSGGHLVAAGDYVQEDRSTVIAGELEAGGAYIQTGGRTEILDGGSLAASQVTLNGGEFAGDVFGDLLLDGVWKIMVDSILDFDTIDVFDDPATLAAEGLAQIVAGSLLQLDFRFDPIVGDVFDVLSADLLLVDVNSLHIADPFADRRFLRASIFDLFDPALGWDRQYLRLTVAVPVPSTLLLLSLGVIVVTFGRRKSVSQGS